MISSVPWTYHTTFSMILYPQHAGKCWVELEVVFEGVGITWSLEVGLKSEHTLNLCDAPWFEDISYF